MAEILIDPKKFTDSQWSELFNASDLIPPSDSRRPQDYRPNAESFTATVDDVESAILACRNKAERVRAGELGPSDAGEGVDIEEWADELDQAAEVLNGLLATPVPHSDRCRCDSADCKARRDSITIDAIQWRESGDDEDSLSIFVGRQTDDQLYQRIADEHELSRTDAGDADNELMVINHSTIKNGEVIECNGKHFKITIEEVAP